MPRPTKTRTLPVLLFVCLALILAGCDPCNPMGIRQLGVYQDPETKDTLLVALVYIWGPCGYGSFFSTDGGLTWSIDRSHQYAGSSYVETRVISGDCVSECQLLDPNEKFQYHITANRILESSLDGGATWQKELIVAPWSLMEQNYAKARFADMGPTPREVRGPFSAVTDPKTGNLVVAMGMEGLLVRTDDNGWQWVSVDILQRLQPTRGEMLSLIHRQEWVRGGWIFLILCLLGLVRAGLARYRRASKTFIALGVVYTALPFELLAAIFYIPLSLLNIDDPINFPSMLALLVWMMPVIISMVLAWLALLSLWTAWPQGHRLVKRLASIAILSTLAFWLPFLLWSQGILFSEYWHASLTALVILAIGYIIIRRYSSSQTNFTNPPILESSNL